MGAPDDGHRFNCATDDKNTDERDLPSVAQPSHTPTAMTTPISDSDILGQFMVLNDHDLGISSAQHAFPHELPTFTFDSEGSGVEPLTQQPTETAVQTAPLSPLDQMLLYPSCLPMNPDSVTAEQELDSFLDHLENQQMLDPFFKRLEERHLDVEASSEALHSPIDFRPNESRASNPATNSCLASDATTSSSVGSFGFPTVLTTQAPEVAKTICHTDLQLPTESFPSTLIRAGEMDLLHERDLMVGITTSSCSFNSYPGSTSLLEPQHTSMIPWTFEDDHLDATSFACNEVVADPSLVEAMDPESAQIPIAQPAPPPSRSTQSNSKRKTSFAGRKQPRISPKAKSRLQEAFEGNPYPSSNIVDTLAAETHLDAKRVWNWFRNTRARIPRHDSAHESQENAMQKLHQPHARLSQVSLERLSQEIPPDHRAPLEAWMSSDERVSETALSAALAAVQPRTLTPIFLLPGSRAPSLAQTNSTHIETGSVKTFGGWSSGSLGSYGSYCTMSSVGSDGLRLQGLDRKRRKGRRATRFFSGNPCAPTSPRQPLSPPLPVKAANKVVYFCTFCHEGRFNRYHEWKRHEESVHMPRKTWVCCPGSDSFFDDCPFCGQRQPSHKHLDGHGYTVCASKTEEDCTFYRRDGFVQHLHSTHIPTVDHSNCDLDATFGCSYLASKWQRQASPLPLDHNALHCGFCGKWSRTWELRCQHVSRHFVDDSPSRSDWWPDRLPIELEDLSLDPSGILRQCRYCRQIFHIADRHHTHCEVWSCRFRPPSYDTWPSATSNCSQEFFGSWKELCGHLQDTHRVPASTLERFQYAFSYSKRLVAVFEPPTHTRNGYNATGPAQVAVMSLLGVRPSASKSIFGPRTSARPSFAKRKRPAFQAPRFHLARNEQSRGITVFYMKGSLSSKRVPLPEHVSCILSEIHQSYVGSLVLSSGLLGMAGLRMGVSVAGAKKSGQWIEIEPGEA